MKKKAFTLAEVMIVLTVIGILSAILLPVAINSTPDKNILKFKKVNQTFMTMMREFASSGEYFTPGDLNLTASGVDYFSDPDGNLDSMYLCRTVAFFLPTKEYHCDTNRAGGSVLATYRPAIDTYEDFKESLEYYCNQAKGPATDLFFTDFIYLNDGSVIFFPFTDTRFGVFPTQYKVVCLDIDEVGQGTKPFGYGVRADGKVLTGARTDWWLSRDITKKEVDCCPLNLKTGASLAAGYATSDYCDADVPVCAE